MCSKVPLLSRVGERCHKIRPGREGQTPGHPYYLFQVDNYDYWPISTYL